MEKARTSSAHGVHRVWIALAPADPAHRHACQHRRRGLPVVAERARPARRRRPRRTTGAHRWTSVALAARRRDHPGARTRSAQRPRRSSATCDPDGRRRTGRSPLGRTTRRRQLPGEPPDQGQRDLGDLSTCPADGSTTAPWRGAATPRRRRLRRRLSARQGVTFGTKLGAAWAASGSMLCVGLDPDPARLPAPLDGAPDAIERFCCAIVDATPISCARTSHRSPTSPRRAPRRALEAVCAHIKERHPQLPILLDAKRGDIGSTAEFYAREVFERYGADAVTYNPYLGTDAAAPLLARGAVFAICRTSNPGSRRAAGPRRRRASAVRAGRRDGRHAVVGARRVRARRRGDLPRAARDPSATSPASCRSSSPGSAPRVATWLPRCAAGATADGTGLLLSSSRAILYASPGEDFAEAARAPSAERPCSAINAG